MKGHITALKRTKGFGFIRDSEGRDRFFHANGLEGTTFDQLQEGFAVEFEPYDQAGAKDNGLRARRVRVV
jgi:cold shock CspA family protein